MNDTPDVFTTDSAPGEDEFEQMVSKAANQYQDYLYGEERYYGPAMDGSLRAAIRAALASGRLVPTTLYAQFGKPDAAHLREAVEDCPAEQQRKLKKRVQEASNDEK